jgi:heme-degrading monooxygenase HmoA
LKYVKHNRVTLKEGSQKRTTEIFREFFKNVKGNVDGMKGYAILENIENDRETVVLTFWDKKENMENYYSEDNNPLQDLVEKVRPHV